MWMVMHWNRKVQLIFLLGIICNLQYGSCDREKRMVQVIRDELELAESIVKQLKTGDWSSRINSGTTPASVTVKNDLKNSITTVPTTVQPTKPRTHISSILKAIKVLGEKKDDKTTPLPKKAYYKGSYKSLSSKKILVPTPLPVILTTVTTSKKDHTTPRNRQISVVLKKQDQLLSSSSIKNKTYESTTAKSTKVPTTPAVFFRRASVKEQSQYKPTTPTTTKTYKVPKSFVSPLEIKLGSPGEMITRSISKSIETAPKITARLKTEKTIKSKPAKKVVIIKKLVRTTPKPKITVPPTVYKYKSFDGYDKSEEFDRSEYGSEKRHLKKNQEGPTYEYEFSHGPYRVPPHIKRMRSSVMASNEEIIDTRTHPTFEIPKIDLSSSNLNEKGCKTRIKEVQEHPVKDKTSSGSDIHLVYDFFPHLKRRKRTVKSIIVTKECFYPGEEEENESTEGLYQTQADNQREIYHPIYHAQEKITQPIKQSSEKKEYSHEDKPQKYSKSYSSSYYSTSKPVRKEYSYYSTSKPMVKQYSSHSESKSDDKDGYRSYHPGAFDHHISGFRHGDQTEDNKEITAIHSRPKHAYSDYEPHGSRGQNYGFSEIPNYSKMASENYQKGLDYLRNSEANHHAHYDDQNQRGYNKEPQNERNSHYVIPQHHSRNGPHHSENAPQSHNIRKLHNDHSSHSHNNRNFHNGQPDNENKAKPKKTKKSFAFYRKDNDPKNQGFSEEYAQGSYTSYSNDYDSDRDGPRN